tara:strand:- start:490 stop:1092 length:603 start_codon:yes stop_codon:yes gene_type:complete
MKLLSIIKEIGFRDRMSKGVDDESKAEFQDFGEYVGKLYQDFQDKDLKSKPEVAQKIRDLVSIEDESSLINQIKDLEFLINQLPDKPESTGKMGFRQNEDENEDEDEDEDDPLTPTSDNPDPEGYGTEMDEDDRSEKDKAFDLTQQLSKLTKDDIIKLKKIVQMMAKEKNEEKINGFDYHYTKGTSGGTQQFGRPRIVNE